MNQSQRPMTAKPCWQALAVLIVYGFAAYPFVNAFWNAGFTGSLVMIGTVALFTIVGFSRVILAIAIVATGLK